MAKKIVTSMSNHRAGRQRFIMGTKDVLAQLRQLAGSDPERARSLRASVASACALRKDWRDAEYDAVEGWAPFFLTALRAFLYREGRLPNELEELDLRMST